MTMTQPGVSALWDDLCSRVKAGDRFAGLFGARPAGGPLVLSAHLATAGGSTHWRRRCRPARPAIPH
jgi:hypothetical protein